MLVQAASGLERLMVKGQDGIIKESIVAQISALIYYQSHVLNSLTGNPAFSNKFKTVIFNQIEKDFGEYIDAKARIAPKTLHHVYEWNRAGNKTYRLFKLNKINAADLSFNISYEFLPSKTFSGTKSKRKHVFVNKAAVMEEGKPLVVSPKYAERLVFDVNGYTVYMPKGKSVYISKPGGVGVKNSFTSAYNLFFTGNLVNLSIKKSGFQRLFNSSITRALRAPADVKRVKYSFSPNSLRSQANFAVTAAFGGAV